MVESRIDSFMIDSLYVQYSGPFLAMKPHNNMLLAAVGNLVGQRLDDLGVVPFGRWAETIANPHGLHVAR
jgi:hypothetical protein